MPPDDFDKFVRNLQKNKESAQEFWQRERDAYISAVDDVYRHVAEFLEPWTSRGEIAIEFHPYELHEEDTGIYQTRKCIIMIGRRSVALTPVGTQLIGTKGRIDISGAFGRSRLVMVDVNSKGPRIKVTVSDPNRPTTQTEPEANQEIDWVWRIATNPPHIKFLDFSRENFLNTILEVSNG